MMEEQTVRGAIRKLIERKENRSKALYAERKGVNKDEKPAAYRKLTEDMARIEHGIMSLIELEHNLHLCDCPPEAWDKAVQS